MQYSFNRQSVEQALLDFNRLIACFILDCVMGSSSSGKVLFSSLWLNEFKNSSTSASSRMCASDASDWK